MGTRPSVANHQNLLKDMSPDVPGEPLYDSPITHPDQDRLGRVHFAQSLARAILTMRADNGFVLALCGPWGSGKTSLLNLVLHYLQHPNQVAHSAAPHDSLILVRFNPWWFSGRDQLIQQFFLQVRAAIGVRKDITEALPALGSLLDNFARLLEPLKYIPLITPWMWARNLIQSVGQFFKGTGDPSKCDPSRVKQKICDTLRKSRFRLLVVIDDIDRLAKHEVRQIFQLVKAVADFPKTIYLLAFDREAVVRMLDDDAGGTAVEYLEKIVQAPLTVPALDRPSLRKLFFEQVHEAIQGTPTELWDATEWGNLYWDGLDALIRTPRSIKQYINTLRPLYAAVAGEVRGVDFLGIHAIRVVCPAALQLIATSKDLMVGDRYGTDDENGRNVEKRRARFDGLLQLVQEEHRPAVQNILRRLFPRFAHAYGEAYYGTDWLPRWARERRVCSPEVFDCYFQLAVPPGAISNAEFAAILSAGRDRREFARELRRLRHERQPDGSPRLRAFLERWLHSIQDQIPAESVNPMLQAVLEAGDELFDPLDSRGLLALDLGDDRYLEGCWFRLLKKLPDAETRLAAVKDAFKGGVALSLMVAFYDYLETDAHRSAAPETGTPASGPLVAAEALPQLGAILLEKIEAVLAERRLLATPRLAAVLRFWTSKRSTETVGTAIRSLFEDDRDFAVLLSRFVGPVHIHGIADRVATRKWRIDLPFFETTTGASAADLVPRCEKLLAAPADWLDERIKTALETLISEVRSPKDNFGRPRSPGAGEE